jgi:drug/metabolite transporter (DMT)-like permease
VPWIVAGTFAQILATALMLAAMNERSFVVSIAYIKTEPVQVALFGLVFLGDAVTIPIAAAILIATAGVVLMSVTPGQIAGAGGNRPALLGIAAGAMFALSAVGYRGAILSLDTPSYVMAATFTLAVGLVIQAALLSLYLAIRDRTVLTKILRAWRPSLAAGFLGAFASQFWFLAFALATAASVRTLALVEVLFAQAISTFFFRRSRPRARRWGSCSSSWVSCCCSGRAASSVFRQHRQRLHLDALFHQFLHFLGLRLAIDRARSTSS